MSKSKKTTKKSYRSRRVSGVGKLNTENLFNQIAGTVAGVAAAGYMNKLLLANRSTAIQAAVPAAAGILIPSMLLKTPFGQALGNGMIAFGGIKFLSSVGLAGVAGVDDITIPVSVSGADGTLSIMAGDYDYAMSGDDYYAMAGDLSTIAAIDDDGDF